MFSQASTGILDLQRELATLQKQTSSGNKFDNFVDMGTDISRIQDMQASIAATSRFSNNNDIALSRLHLMDSAVSQIQDVASQLSSSLVTENSASGSVFDLAGFARNALQQVEGALNTSQAGRSLFAGSKTDQGAVGNLTISTNVFNDISTPSYYNGDSFIASVQASDTLSLDYGVTAGDKAFQDIIGALHKAIDLDASNTSADRQLASDLLQSAITRLTSVRSGINNSIVTLTSVNDQHSQVKVQLTDALSKLTGTDVVQASISASQIEATLTATMQMFARITSLRLVDFLK